MRRALILTAALALSASLAACSDEPADQSAASDRDKTWDTPEGLLGALNKGGFKCIGYEAVADPAVGLAGGECKHDGRGVVVWTYASAADAKAAPAEKRELLRGVVDVIMLVGPNWTLSCGSKPDCEAAEKVVGGELVHYPK